MKTNLSKVACAVKSWRTCQSILKEREGGLGGRNAQHMYSQSKNIHFHPSSWKKRSLLASKVSITNSRPNAAFCDPHYHCTHRNALRDSKHTQNLKCLCTLAKNGSQSYNCKTAKTIVIISTLFWRHPLLNVNPYQSKLAPSETYAHKYKVHTVQWLQELRCEHKYNFT